jgi:hypothetical protein
MWTPESTARRPLTLTLARTAGLTRGRLLATQRIAVRVTLVVIIAGRGGNGVGLLVTALVSCAGYDLLLGYLSLRRPLPMAVRVCLDAADVAVWSVVVGHPVDVPAILGMSLGYEAVMRRSRWAPAVPVILGVVTNTALRLAGQPLSAAPLLWPATAVVGAAVIVWYLHATLRTQVRLADADRAGAEGQAHLAGQHSVAMGADTIVDLITRTWPLLPQAARADGNLLARWRQQLAEDGARDATYLGTALLRWAKQRNDADPDLSHDVIFHLPPGEGTLLLSAHQATTMDQILHALAPRGQTCVSVVATRPLGQRQHLRIGDTIVVLPADPPAAAPLIDPGPVIIALSGLAALNQSWPTFEAVPWPATTLVAATAAPLAWWAHHAVSRRGPAGYPTVLVAVLILGAIDAVVATLLMRNPAANGLHRLPCLHVLYALGPLLVIYSDRLRRRWLAAATGAAALIVGTGVWLQPTPLAAVDLADLAWPAAFLLAALGIQRSLRHDTATLAATLARDRNTATDLAYQTGRRSVIDLVDHEAQRLAAARHSHRDTTDPDLATEIDHRLTEITHRLHTLRTTPKGRDRAPQPTGA